MKKITAIVLVIAMVFTLCACGVNTSFTSTTTTTTTDADGNVHTETTTTSTQNGQTTTSSEVTDQTAAEAFEPFVDVPVVIVNNSDEAFTNVHIRCSGDEEWDENLLDEDLPVGESREVCTVNFDYDHRFFDVLTEDAGGELEFTEMNFANGSHDQITVEILFIEGAEKSYKITIS